MEKHSRAAYRPGRAGTPSISKRFSLRGSGPRRGLRECVLLGGSKLAGYGLMADKGVRADPGCQVRLFAWGDRRWEGHQGLWGERNTVAILWSEADCHET